MFRHGRGVEGLAGRGWIRAAVLLATGIGCQLVRADPTWEFAVQLTASVQESPPQITLNWIQDSLGTPLSYTVYRKLPSDSSWSPGTVLPGTVTNFADDQVEAGTVYEYQVVKQALGYVGYGYLCSGMDVPLVEDRGKVLLIVDQSFSESLSNELACLEQDLVGDGWSVIRQDVSRGSSPPEIKSWIQDQYFADPAGVKCVFLFGHVPVPYSGDICPDTHVPGHQGAWPADVYYGDMNGVWTDDTVYDTGADDPRNWNVPGDGKWDQSAVPGNVDLMVGRVDLANMPGEETYGAPPTFPDETELLRRYLNKDHNFRQKWIDLPRRGLIYDGFGAYRGYAYAASAWRNFAPFFGASGIDVLTNSGEWISTLSQSDYLWAYGCGAGQYTGINGLGTTGPYAEATTLDLVAADIHAPFTLLFGSWLGDWDTQDNFMRAVLAGPTYGLVCCWSGAPHWFLQHMALGEPVGFSTRLTQNNGPDGLYQNATNASAGFVHVALMGDPTLRMHVVAPVTGLSAAADSGNVQLSWAAANDTVVGYAVYRAAAAGGPYQRLTSPWTTDTFFIDAGMGDQSWTYMVRAVKLENTPSGTYYNGSEGQFVTAPAPAPVTPPVLSISTSSAGIILTWSTVPGAIYDVEYKDNLTDLWIALGLNAMGDGTDFYWTDAAPLSAPQRFYRISSY